MALAWIGWLSLTINFWLSFIIIFPGSLGYWTARIRKGYDKEMNRAP